MLKFFNYKNTTHNCIHCGQ